MAVPIFLPSDDPLFFNSLALQSQEKALRFRYEEMRRDCHITGLQEKLVGSVVGRETLITPYGGKQAKKVDIEAAEKAQQIRDKMKYNDLRNALFDAAYIGNGFAYLKEWQKQDSLLIPVFDYIPWWRFTFQEPQTSNSVPISGIDSNNKNTKYAMHLGYEVRLLTKAHPIWGERVPEKKFLIYTFGSNSFPFGFGLAWRYFPWWITKNACRDSLIRQGGRVGSPPIIATHPETYDESNQEQSAVLLKWRRFLQAVSPNGYFEGIKGFEAAIVDQVKNSSPELLQFLFKESDNQMSKAALSEVPQSESGTGSYAAGESQVDDREANIIDKHCISLDAAIAPLWDWIAELNYPGANPPDIRTWTTNETSEEEQLKAEIDRLNITADCWKKLIDIGLKPSDELVKRTFGDDWTMTKPDDGLGDFGGSGENAVGSGDVPPPSEGDETSADEKNS
ncbi:MAG: hypothetical protein PUP93_18735 [Rhizonema sp. NSF051]|nr:hypothetical protein [Rhizonema sp. NSF051]